MTHNRLDYVALMHERGFRVTPQRQLILDAIGEGGGHTTFEEVFGRVQRKSSAVNRATVYRTLDFLVELRLVVAADVGGGRLVYEIAGETPHHHLVCLNCRTVRQISHEAVAQLFTQIEQEQKFHVETNHLALFGYCEDCLPKMTFHNHAHELEHAHAHAL
ncbi:MAG: transcriptional repressor [Anaerolineales bacterium]|nr:transcriptional repressor [Anaerolineales bacterium]